MGELLTAGGQLALASEFRFDVLHTEHEHNYVTVKRGRGRLSDKWAIAASESEYGRFFNPVTGCWSFDIRGADAYVWELEPALLKARELAAAAHQEITGIMERRKERVGDGKTPAAD